MQQNKRQKLMAVLARADMASLVEKWQSMAIDPLCEVLRGPETGLVGLKGRIGGGGDTFNYGEATITRMTIRLSETGKVGHATHLGRNREKVKLSAIIDAVAQDEALENLVWNKIIKPLEEKQKQQDKKHQAQIAATKVDFFTLARGDD